MAETAPQKKGIFQALARVGFYTIILACYVSSILLRKLGYFYETPVVLFLLAGIAFSGIIGLLGDYIWRIRKTPWVWIPILLLFEILAELVYTAGFRGVALLLSIPGSFLYPVFGLLFLIKGFRILRAEKKLGLSFIVLGLLATSLITWEYVSWYPEDYSKSALQFRILYLATFGWLLFMEFVFPRIEDRGYKIESQILSLSLVAVAIMYFMRFLFT